MDAREISVTLNAKIRSQSPDASRIEFQGRRLGVRIVLNVRPSETTVSLIADIYREGRMAFLANLVINDVAETITDAVEGVVIFIRTDESRLSVFQDGRFQLQP
jgi:hypothetical protein